MKCDKNISASVKLSVIDKILFNVQPSDLVIEGTYIVILSWSFDKPMRVALYSCKLLQLHTYLYVQQNHDSLL
jgi:hypothetical protein